MAVDCVATTEFYVSSHSASLALFIAESLAGMATRQSLWTFESTFILGRIGTAWKICCVMARKILLYYHFTDGAFVATVQLAQMVARAQVQFTLTRMFTIRLMKVRMAWKIARMATLKDEGTKDVTNWFSTTLYLSIVATC